MEKFAQEKLKTRKALVKHEMEKLESDFVTSKRQIDQQDDFAIPRLEKQLK